jgi:hypothetical protein
MPTFNCENSRKFGVESGDGASGGSLTNKFATKGKVVNFEILKIEATLQHQ